MASENIAVCMNFGNREPNFIAPPSDSYGLDMPHIDEEKGENGDMSLVNQPLSGGMFVSDRLYERHSDISDASQHQMTEFEKSVLILLQEIKQKNARRSEQAPENGNKKSLSTILSILSSSGYGIYRLYNPEDQPTTLQQISFYIFLVANSLSMVLTLSAALFQLLASSNVRDPLAVWSDFLATAALFFVGLALTTVWPAALPFTSGLVAACISSLFLIVFFVVVPPKFRKTLGL